MARISHQYRLNKATGRAFISIKSKRIYLGKYGTEESKNAYRIALLEYQTTGKVEPQTKSIEAEPFTVNEMLVPYVQHIDGYYVNPDGRPTGEARNIKIALRILKEKFGTIDARLFGAESLEACRDEMVRKGWCRRSCNANTYRIRRAFKWAARKRMIPAAVLADLSTLEGLAPFRSAARETAPIKPAPDEHIEKCLPFFTSPVAAMVQLQRLTGMRPGEVLQVKGMYLKREGDVWLYSPPRHKNAWRGKERTIYLGPKAQAIVAPFLKADPEAFLFDPRAGRKEFVSKSYGKCKEKKRPRRGKKVPNERYWMCSYQGAVRRACKRAGVPNWSPNQLRHSHATEVRQRFGLEAASVVLGHAKCDVTQVYAEANTEKAIEVMRLIG